jgi:hypothetical protein
VAGGDAAVESKGVGARAAVLLAVRAVSSIRHRKLRQELDGEALTCSAELDGLADGDMMRRALRVADGEVEGLFGRPLLADEFAFVILRLWTGRHGVAVVVFGAEVDYHRVRDDDLVAARVERVAGVDRQFVGGWARPDAVQSSEEPG